MYRVIIKELCVNSRENKWIVNHVKLKESCEKNHVKMNDQCVQIHVNHQLCENE